MQPRWYQQDLIEKTRAAWDAGAINVLVVSPPRSGKTPTAVWLSEPFIVANQAVCVCVHREELVKQIANTYAAFGYEHNVIAPAEVIAGIIQSQVQKYGRSFVRSHAKVTVGSVQTIGSRIDALAQWASEVRLWIVDEAHHILAGTGLWGKVVAMFPKAKGLGFTATPARTDRKSLSRKQGGVFDVMVKGVTARQLINEGSICEYRIIAPPSSIDRSQLKEGASGEYTPSSIKESQRKSTITGDCVESYLKFTPGEQAVVFAVDVEHATELRDAYVAKGVSAEMVSAKTPRHVRKAIMDKFERGVFQVLCNVDLFGEGLNVLGISVVIMGRPTQSFVLYVQQFFRALTAAKDKFRGTIIDHVGNVGHFGKTYGLPDSYNSWTLENDEGGKRRKRDPDQMPVTTCPACYFPYEAFHTKCPHCGHKPEPAGRSMPQQVAGDLVELDPAVLKIMRGEADAIMRDNPVVVTDARTKMIAQSWGERIEAQKELRDRIATWAWKYHVAGETDSEIQKRFWYRFGQDVLTAQALGAREAHNLKMEIDNALD